jgi:hypothetical protein
VFIPWLLLRPASFLFDGWLRFTLVAALYQVVGMVIVTLVSRMHEPMLATVGPAIGGGSAAFNFYYFAAAFLLSGVSALMMLQVPAIASGLVNGSVAARFQTGTAVVAASDRGARSGARMIARSGAQLMAGLGQARAGRTAQAQGPTSLPRIEPSMVGSSQAR